MQRLGASKIVQIDFMPKELVTYSRETQTPVAPDQSEGIWKYMNIYEGKKYG